MTAVNPASADEKGKLQVALEPKDDLVLLRFEAGEDGRARPVLAESQAPPHRCAERFLLGEGAGVKRRRLAGSGKTAVSEEAEKERVRILREAQQSSLEGIKRATTAAQLLGRTDWGADKIRFLTLRNAAPKPLSLAQIKANALEAEEAAVTRPAEIRAAVAAREGAQVTPEVLKEFEGTLRFLRSHWQLHCFRGRYAVELWTGEKGNKSLAGKPLVWLSQHPEKGICLRFPSEVGQLVESRRQLSVCVKSLTSGSAGAASSSAGGSSPAKLRDPSLSRPQALHEALLEAQRLLLDALAFARLRQAALAASAGARSDEGGFQEGSKVLRVASCQVVLGMVLDDAKQVVEVIVRHQSAGTSEEDPLHASSEKSEAQRLWQWMAELATLQLRDLYLHCGRHEPSAEAPQRPDLLTAFEAWAQPRFEAAAKYLGRER